MRSIRQSERYLESESHIKICVYFEEYSSRPKNDYLNFLGRKGF